MSSSSWPPELKAWVQQCLAQATSANKDAVNKELRDLLFQAHKDGTVASTDWSTVKLKTLTAQTHRTSAPLSAHTPASYAYPAPNPTVSPNKSKKKNNKKRKGENSHHENSNASKKAFPSAYTFASSTAEEEEAKARRLARFQRDAPPATTAGPQANDLGHWFQPDESNGSALGNRIAGLYATPGKKKLRGKSGLGYSEAEMDPNVIDWDAYTIRGTSTKLEKSYLRLTSEPSPADIRPLPVLEQTLQLLKKKWKTEHNYAYAVDQFKSVRQDLTVQRIKNEFTVEVYEIHARIALEAKDLGEYNQCQSMLRQLYELGIKGHPEEFLSYRIIYLLHTRNRSDMASLLAQLSPKEKEDPGVAHALAVARALATSNYTKFFRLFMTAPGMSGYIMDHFVDRERAQALAIMSKAYLTLPLPYLTTTLAFAEDADTDAFLADHHAAVYTNVPEGPAARNPKNPWKPIAPVPLAERIWDCKRAQHGCARGVDKYRVVDLKGQVD